MKKFPFVHVALFILTLLSTLSVGAMQTGVDLLKEPEKIYKGLPFALSLMIILLSHELSHYFTSKKHGVKATLPYFIPAPTFIGTLGAFIKMKSPIFTRKALVDIGASGPVAGFIVSVIVTIIGLHLSKVVPAPQIPAAETRDAIIVYFGNSLIFSSLSQMTLGAIPSGWDILLHPVARAGWIGLFVTSINLIPVGQLDGGHVAYALFGGKIHKRTSVIIFGALLFMGVAKVFTSGDYFPGILNISRFHGFPEELRFHHIFP